MRVPNQDEVVNAIWRALNQGCDDGTYFDRDGDLALTSRSSPTNCSSGWLSSTTRGSRIESTGMRPRVDDQSLDEVRPSRAEMFTIFFLGNETPTGSGVIVCPAASVESGMRFSWPCAPIGTPNARISIERKAKTRRAENTNQVRSETAEEGAVVHVDYLPGGQQQLS